MKKIMLRVVLLLLSLSLFLIQGCITAQVTKETDVVLLLESFEGMKSFSLMDRREIVTKGYLRKLETRGEDNIREFDFGKATAIVADNLEAGFITTLVNKGYNHNKKTGDFGVDYRYVYDYKADWYSDRVKKEVTLDLFLRILDNDSGEVIYERAVSFQVNDRISPNAGLQIADAILSKVPSANFDDYSKG